MGALELQVAKRTVAPNNLRVVSPEWGFTSIIRFCEHYKQYDFLSGHIPLPPEVGSSNDKAVDEVEKRLACLMHKEVPRPLERLMAHRRKKPLTSSGAVAAFQARPGGAELIEQLELIRGAF